MSESAKDRLVIAATALMGLAVLIAIAWTVSYGTLWASHHAHADLARMQAQCIHGTHLVQWCKDNYPSYR